MGSLRTKEIKRHLLCHPPFHVVALILRCPLVAFTDPIGLWDGVTGDLVRVRMETGRN